MAESKKEVVALVIGTCHEYQRHQDTVEGSEQIRAMLEKRIREVISDKKIDLIAEEAGNDKEVWNALKEQEKMDFEALGALLEGTEIVNEPTQTIAKIVADECHFTHIDIRPPNADKMTVLERDVAMGEKIVGSRGSATRVLVIVGQAHQPGVAEFLANADFLVATESFPAVPEQAQPEHE
jgi:pheromone shutdown protein TraB